MVEQELTQFCKTQFHVVPRRFNLLRVCDLVRSFISDVFPWRTCRSISRLIWQAVGPGIRAGRSCVERNGNQRKCDNENPSDQDRLSAARTDGELCPVRRSCYD